MTEPTGWICPKCGRVYAPWVKECETCAPLKTAPAIEPWPPYYPYPWYPSPPLPWTPDYPYPTIYIPDPHPFATYVGWTLQ